MSTKSKMAPPTQGHADLPAISNDPVCKLLIEGRAKTLHEAEELYLNESLDEVSRLCGSNLSNEGLSSHPLMELLVRHGSRGWEDSLL